MLKFTTSRAQFGSSHESTALIYKGLHSLQSLTLVKITTIQSSRA